VRSPQPIEDLTPFAWQDATFAEAKFNGDSIWLTNEASAFKPRSQTSDETSITFPVYHSNGEKNERFTIYMDSTSVGCYGIQRKVETFGFNSEANPTMVFLNIDMGDLVGPIFVHDTTATFASNICITAIDEENDRLQGRFNLAFRLMENGPSGLIPGEHPAKFELTDGVFQADIERR